MIAIDMTAAFTFLKQDLCSDRRQVIAINGETSNKILAFAIFLANSGNSSGNLFNVDVNSFLELIKERRG